MNSSSIPGETIIQIIVIIALALIISQFFPHKNDQINDGKFGTERVLNILYTIAGGLIVLIVFDFFGIIEINGDYKNITAIGILISALMASTSIMKSIKNSINIEKEKEKRDLLEKRLDIYKGISTPMSLMLRKTKLTDEEISKAFLDTRASKFYVDNKIVEFIDNELTNFLNHTDRITRLDWISEDIEYKNSDILQIKVEDKKKYITYKRPGSNMTYSLEAKSKINDLQKEISDLNREKKEINDKNSEYLKGILQKQRDLEKLFEKYLKFNTYNY